MNPCSATGEPECTAGLVQCNAGQDTWNAGKESPDQDPLSAVHLYYVPPEHDTFICKSTTVRDSLQQHHMRQVPSPSCMLPAASCYARQMQLKGSLAVTGTRTRNPPGLHSCYGSSSFSTPQQNLVHQNEVALVIPRQSMAQLDGVGGEQNPIALKVMCTHPRMPVVCV